MQDSRFRTSTRNLYVLNTYSTSTVIHNIPSIFTRQRSFKSKKLIWNLHQSVGTNSTSAVRNSQVVRRSKNIIEKRCHSLSSRYAIQCQYKAQLVYPLQIRGRIITSQMPHTLILYYYVFPCDHPQTVSSAWISIKHCRTLTFVCRCTSLSFLRSLHSLSSTLIQPNAELFKDPNYISQVPTPNKSPGSECRSTSHGSSCNQSSDYHSCSSEAQCAPLYPFSQVWLRGHHFSNFLVCLSWINQNKKS